ncbi:MAG: hypothetical protein ACKO1F_10350 [Flammeovirgaceae bacterium]
MKLLVGIWFVLSAEMSGKDITAAFANERMEITDTGYKIWSGDIVTDIGLLTFDEGAGELDIVGTEGSNKGKTFKCIYKMEGDNVVICYSLVLS